MIMTSAATSTPFRTLALWVLALTGAGMLAACSDTTPGADTEAVEPITATIAALSAADSAGDPPTADADAESPTTADLRQAHLRLGDAAADVRLTDGTFTAPPPAGQATGGLDVRLLDDPVGHGDLNGDGAPDAVIAVAADMGGSGRFVYLAPYLAGGARPDPIPSVLLGDRVQVKALTIVDGRLTADLVVHGPNDPMCCPNQAERREFVLAASGALTPAP